MIYGDGDGHSSTALTIALDVIGHELTHGVTQYTSNLNYQNQSGALNESFSDVFGSLVKTIQTQPDGGSGGLVDWSGFVYSQCEGVALRSMKAPGTAYDDPVLGKDPQPATMAGYVNSIQDNGGVHINSGIPIMPFICWPEPWEAMPGRKAGKIWFTAGKEKFKSDTDFQGAADLDLPDRRRTLRPEQHRTTGGSERVVGVGIIVGAGTQTQPQPQSGGCLPALISLLQSLPGGNTKR